MKKLYKVFYFLGFAGFFFKKYFLQNPLYVFLYGSVFFLPDFSFRPRFLKKEEISNILKQKSFLRIGDGEVHIMLGQGIGFQKKDKRLAGYLKKSIVSYTESSPYVLGINERVMSKSNRYLREKQALRLWLPMKIFYYLYFPKRTQYIDASLFYYRASFTRFLGDVLQGKDVILVSRKENIENFISRAKGMTIYPVETKAQNAFDDFDSIVQKIKLIASEQGYKKCVVLAACGPASKAIVYELSPFLQVIDIGVGLEIAFTGESLEDIISL